MSSTQVGNSVFTYFSTGAINFSGAQSFCAAKGQSLARISTKAEHTAIANLRNSLGIEDNFWIGIRANDGAGQANPNNFFYVDGNTAELDFIHVGRGVFPWSNDPNSVSGPEPNNQNDNNVSEDCVEWDIFLVDLSISNRFNDIACSLGHVGVLCRSEIPTASPTRAPTKFPTIAPTKSPTKFPTLNPTKSPTKFPTKSPTKSPTKFPTKSPTKSPTKFPTPEPTPQPTRNPTKFPTRNPTLSPTPQPTQRPSSFPTRAPNSVDSNENDNSDNLSTEETMQLMILGLMAVVLIILCFALAKYLTLRRKRAHIIKKIDNAKFESHLNSMEIFAAESVSGSAQSVRYKIAKGNSISSDDI